MNKEFIRYKEALELKQLEFNEPCLATYRGGDLYSLSSGGYYSDGLWDEHKNNTEGNQWVSAPTFPQAFRWFREKHDIHSYIEIEGDEFDYTLVSDLFNEEVDFGDGLFNTYEEAELTCLRKLIQIVKEKQQ